MCIPCGPKGYGCPGREAYRTIEDGRRFNLEAARECYPDNDEAMKLIFAFTDEHIDHTQKWMIDRMYWQDGKLLRIAAEEENFAAWKKYYSKQKRIYTSKI